MRRSGNLGLWTTADLATLATAHLAAGNASAALDHARQAVTLLDECAGIGPEFPHRDYFACYRVFAQIGQDEEAAAALHSSYRLLMAQADKIAEPAYRGSFLEGIQIHQQIAKTWRDQLQK